MNQNWSDFEKFVFQKLSTIEQEIASLKARAAVWGAAAGALTYVVSQFVIKAIKE